jgi:ketosteroid isomerase-like protein
MKKAAYFFAILVILIACNPTQQNPENEQKAETKKEAFDLELVKKAIADANAVYGKRFIENDPTFYDDKYCDDAIVFPAENPAVSGKENIRKYFYNDGKGKEIKIELSNPNIYGSAELVVEEGTYNFPDGKGGSLDKGKFMALWKQEDGKWKLYREIWNTDIAPKSN